MVVETNVSIGIRDVSKALIYLPFFHENDKSVDLYFKINYVVLLQ